MKYIVIENWESLSSPQLCTNEEGETLVFDNLKEATSKATECHNGIVVPLCEELMTIIQEAYDLIGMAKFKIGEDFDAGDDESVEGRLGLLTGY